MTLAVQSRIVRYAGNGATTTFAIPFSFYTTNSAVEVTLKASDGTETLQTISVHYSISGTNVVMVTAPATGQTLIIRSNLDLQQQAVDFTDNVPFLPTTVEDGLDRVAAMVQQLGEIVSRCWRVRKGNTNTNIEYRGSQSASTSIGWSSDGSYLQDGPSFGDITNAATYAANAATSASSAASSANSASTSASQASSSASAAATSASSAASSAASAAAAAASAVGTDIQEQPSGTCNGSNTAFTLSQTPVASASVLLFQNGIALIQGTHYTISGKNITMTSAPQSTQTLYARYRY